MTSAFSCLLVLLAASTASGTIYRGVGYDTLLPNVDLPPPYLPTPEDTSSVAQRAIFESRLTCVERTALYRATYCDINTFDSCGNRFGLEGNITMWKISVVNKVTQRASRLVSPVVHVASGVARFYFTPVELGVYEVLVERRAQPNGTAELLSTMPMKRLVVIHNTVAPCSTPVAGMHPQLQNVLWSVSSFMNEAPAFLPGRQDLPRRTNIVADGGRVFDEADGTSELGIRRETIPARPYGIVGSQPVDSNVQYCDVIQQG